MGRRRKARELLVQALYASVVGEKPLDAAVAEQIERRGPTDATVDYVQRVVGEIAGRLHEVDRRIDAALTGWSPDRVGAVERAVLRLALVEMLHLPETPPKAAVSEAVDLARTFGTDDGARFVNGVLDRILKEEAA